MEEKESTSFGAVLSRYRAAVGLSQEELAEHAGLSVRGVSDLERGARTRPHATTVHQLSEALRLSPDERAILERSASRAKEAGTPTVSSSPAPGSFLGAVPGGPFVGREEEVGRIRSALEAAAEGKGQLLLLVGELGVGKTRLAQEVTVQIRDPDGLAAKPTRFMLGTARCYQRHRQTSYVPLFEALSELAGTAPPSARLAFASRWETLRRHVDSLATDGAAGVDRQRHPFVALTDFLTDLGAVASIALVFDDLHHADDGTIGLLQDLARETRGKPVLLVGTLRDANLGEDHPLLVQTLQELARERLAERILVRRLSAEETARLAAGLMGEDTIADEFAAFIYRRSKGIPRFIEGMIQALGGRLELHGEIGAGAMGRVFAAYDAQTEREVAAKLMLARTEVGLDALLRFQHEAAVLVKLRHPRIVEIYDSFIDEHASCIIMERIDGRSLGQVLQQGALPLARAKHLAQQVADALDYAHAQQIVHRDIKPDNVMVLDGDQVKVTDFGIARILQPDTSLQTIATTGMRMGTPLYMAPEQIEGKGVDGRTDIYALGAMIYHMVIGRPPFEGSDAMAVAVKHLREEALPPSHIDPAIPADWDALILKAMAKDPVARFQSATDMQRAIASLGEQAAAPFSTAKRMPRLVATIGLLLAVIIGATGFWAHVAASHSSTLSARLDGYFNGLAAGGHLSGTVLVAKSRNPIFVKGYGYADRAAHMPNGPNTKYADVAISTALSIAELEYVIQGGYVRLDNKICAYLPSCPASWTGITVRSLLDGTSHLPDYAWGHPGNTARQSLAACQALPLDPSSFGKAEYQVCTNLVLALISEKFNGNSLNGIPWAQNQMFQLAAMHSSGQMTDAFLSPQRALGVDE